MEGRGGGLQEGRDALGNGVESGACRAVSAAGMGRNGAEPPTPPPESPSWARRPGARRPGARDCLQGSLVRTARRVCSGSPATGQTNASLEQKPGRKQARKSAAVAPGPFPAFLPASSRGLHASSIKEQT